MKSLFPFFLLVLFLAGCKEECIIEEDLVAPESLTVTKMSKLPLVEGIYRMQFHDQDVGFVLGITENDTIKVMKTMDGGSSWDFINPPIGTFPNDFFFLNDTVGFLTQYDDNNYPSLWKTINGGETWTELSFLEFSGRMKRFQVDQNGKLYAEIGAIGEPTLIVRSVDQGESWEMIYSLPPITLEMYKVVGDQIYMVTTDKEIIFTDLNGQNEQLVNIDHTNNTSVDLEVIDEDNWVLTSFYSAVKTDDAGATWTQIYDAPSRIVSFKDPLNGIMLLNTGYCGDNPIERGVLATTTDGGFSWEESAHSEYLSDRIEAISTVGNTSFVLLDNWSFDYYELYLVE